MSSARLAVASAVAVAVLWPGAAGYTHDTAGNRSANAIRDLGDFESDAEVERWRTSEAPRPDCRLADLSRSTQFASHGESSLRAIFTKHEMGKCSYVILEPSIDNGGLNLTDWSS